MMNELYFFTAIEQEWTKQFELKKIDKKRWISKREFAVLLDKTIDPFQLKTVDFNGQLN